MYADLAYIVIRLFGNPADCENHVESLHASREVVQFVWPIDVFPLSPFSLPTPFLSLSPSLSEDLRMTWRIFGIQKTFGFQLLLLENISSFCLRVSCDVSFLFRDPNGLRISGIFFLCFLPSSFLLHFLFVCAKLV